VSARRMPESTESRNTESVRNRCDPAIPVLPATQVRSALRRWYESTRRDLPWRRTSDPYRIWVSEIMLQQTRVAAVLPYYARFLERFPDAPSLARAPEAEVLAAWAGLGYYSRARNLQSAAKRIVANGGFPRDYAGIRLLPGIGDSTAAAIASIAFGLPHAVLDGNVMRVLARLSDDAGDIGSAATRTRLLSLAGELLDRRRPGEFNQALMELGATVCLPKNPQCPLCPTAAFCKARLLGTQASLPLKSRRAESVPSDRQFLLIHRDGEYLLWQRPPGAGGMAGFWELPEPEQLPGASSTAAIGRFRHTIMNHRYSVTVLLGRVGEVPPGFEWIAASRLPQLPLSTLARKALRYENARELPG
jgi:A/G-specific adenine glycosylase